MPPKPKESATKKPPPQILRPSVSDSSLNYIPDDAVEGFQERIESGINWTLTEEAARYHKEKRNKNNIRPLSFLEALQNKIKKSILNGFLDENSTFSFKDQWEVLLPMTIWDHERFSNEEGKICFNSANSLTDNIIEMIKRAVQHGDRQLLKRELKMVTVLRVIDSEMTVLDGGVKEYKNLVTLNLSGNFIVDLDASVLPEGLRMLELQANLITTVVFGEHLPNNLIYLGLSRNLINNDGVFVGLTKLPYNITALDLSDNDIYDLDVVLTALSVLPNLVALQLAGNPCSVCAAYARATLMRLPRLQWLDCREVLSTDRPTENFEPHTDDFRSAYFNFTIFRIMSVLQTPKPEKGAVTTFHVELELPLLDSTRRKFLMFRNSESLVELMPPPEDEEWASPKLSSFAESKMVVDPESSSHESDIYNHLTSKNSREICHFTTFESNRVQWNKIMNFQEPTVRIFCPNLLALRDTFRTVVTLRLVYSVVKEYFNNYFMPYALFLKISSLGQASSSDGINNDRYRDVQEILLQSYYKSTTVGKQSKKSAQAFKSPPGEQRVTLATIKCALKRPDWSQSSQHFHWDDSMGTDEAMHWGDGDLSVLQYTLAAVKTPKGKPDSDPGSTRQFPPENLTCHFGFGIDTLKV